MKIDKMLLKKIKKLAIAKDDPLNKN